MSHNGVNESFSQQGCESTVTEPLTDPDMFSLSSGCLCVTLFHHTAHIMRGTEQQILFWFIFTNSSHSKRGKSRQTSTSLFSPTHQSVMFPSDAKQTILFVYYMRWGSAHCKCPVFLNVQNNLSYRRLGRHLIAEWKYRSCWLNQFIWNPLKQQVIYLPIPVSLRIPGDITFSEKHKHWQCSDTL